MQTLVVKVIEGPETGQQATLRNGQQLRVGSSSWAELSCPQDTDLQDVHFAILSSAAGWVIHAVKPACPVYCNGVATKHVVLKHGDQVSAGSSRFQILDAARAALHEPLPSSERADDHSTIPPAPVSPWPALLEKLDIPSEGLELSAEKIESPPELLEQFLQAERWEEASRFVAACLGPKESVAWELQAVQQLQEEEEINFSAPTQQQALQAAQAWVETPAEEQRRQAEQAAQAAGFQTAAGWIAQTVFWSGGSLSLPDLPLAPAPPWLYTKAVQAAFNLLILQTGTLQMPPYWQKLLAIPADKLAEVSSDSLDPGGIQ